MSALRIMSFTSTPHYLSGDHVNMLEKRTRRSAVATTAQTRSNCSKPTTTGVGNVARKQQAHEDTPQSRPVAAKTAATATDDAYTTANVTKLRAEFEWDMYCDVLPNSSICQQELQLHLTPSWPIRDLEEESCDFECEVSGSKKSKRLSSTSWDLLD